MRRAMERFVSAIQQQEEEIQRFHDELLARNRDFQDMVDRIRATGAQPEVINVEPIAEVLQVAAELALKRVGRNAVRDGTWGVNLEAAFRNSTIQVAAQLLEIGKTKLSAKDLIRRVQVEKDAVAVKHRAELAAVKKELASAKVEVARLVALKMEIQRTTFAAFPYQPIPPAMAAAPYESAQSELPELAGIYFAWEEGVVAYVGQSINIRNRCAVRSHEKLREGDWLSWIAVDPDRLDYVESFYIGIAQPQRNFGGRRRARVATEL